MGSIQLAGIFFSRVITSQELFLGGQASFSGLFHYAIHTQTYYMR